MKDESFALLHLNRLPFLGPMSIALLVRRFGSAAAALSCEAKDWEAFCGIELSKAARALCEKERKLSQLEQVQAEQTGIEILSWIDPRYPSSLREIEASPPILYAQGRLEILLELNPALAIVGTRTPTLYGKTQAERFAQSLAAAGVLIVSGMARGVDEIAHRCALEVNGKTVAVLGSGLHQIYPKDNPALLSKLLQQGVLLSEFPLNTLPYKGNFPRRNRIIAGLAQAVLVVEAAAKSGSLLTAQWAIDQGKELFTIPGRVDNPMSRGCHALLKQGAHLAEEAQDVLPFFSKDIAATNEAREVSPLLQTLAGGMKTIDELAQALQKDPDQLLEELLELEISGQVIRGPGGIYRRD